MVLDGLIGPETKGLVMLPSGAGLHYAMVNVNSRRPRDFGVVRTEDYAR